MEEKVSKYQIEGYTKFNQLPQLLDLKGKKGNIHSHIYRIKSKEKVYEKYLI
jgi:hypothetical protein